MFHTSTGLICTGPNPKGQKMMTDPLGAVYTGSMDDFTREEIEALQEMENISRRISERNSKNIGMGKLTDLLGQVFG